jgi:hypothetical protein
LGVPDLPELPEVGRKQAYDVMLDFRSIGRVPYRPIGKSHFAPIPVSYSVGDAYKPAIMDQEALLLSVRKYYEPTRYISDGQAEFLTNWLSSYVAPFWHGDNFTSYADAVLEMDPTKSPGYPWYYTCDTKGCALMCHGDKILEETEEILQGRGAPQVASITLKDELRPRERVDLKKTRAFESMPTPHLLASTQCFHKQNEKLQKQ